MTISIMGIVVLVSVFIYISFWQYIMNFKLRNYIIPYEAGWNIFSVFGWVIILIAMIKIFGILYGILAFLFCCFVLQYITLFTTMFIYHLFFKENLIPPLVCFVTMWWITLSLTITLLIIA